MNGLSNDYQITLVHEFTLIKKKLDTFFKRVAVFTIDIIMH